MTATTADREAKRSDGIIKIYKVAGTTTIFKDTLVCINTDGYATPGSDTADYVLGGIAVEKVDNSGGANGDKEIRVWKIGEFEFFFSGTAAQTNVGEPMYIIDDQTVAVATATTNSVEAGYCQEIINDSTIRVRIDRSVA